MSLLVGLVAGLILALPVSIVMLLIGPCLRRPWSEIFAEVAKFAVEITIEAMTHSF